MPQLWVTERIWRITDDWLTGRAKEPIKEQLEE
jgi:hypothetical protein